MFRIKICGITNPDDAVLAQSAGAEALGLNFYAGSSRHISQPVAEQIVSAVRGACECVGVFVNASTEEVNRIATDLQLDWVQLHGDESPEAVSGVAPRFRLIRVHRISKDGLQSVAADLQACRQAGRAPDLVLADASVAGQYGGTGAQLDWSGLAEYRSLLGEVRLVLAGGLTADNVADAIRTVRPWGVDVASGVESTPGKKDPALVRAFVERAQSAFAELAE